MKKIKNYLVITAVLFVTVIGCKSTSEKNNDLNATEEEMQDAQKNAKEAEQNLLESSEWLEFEKAANLAIAENETKIAELRVKMSKSGRTFDKLYEKNIDRLEEENRNLKMRLEAYKKSQSGWESFKDEFNRDMENLGNAIRDLGVDNK